MQVVKTIAAGRYRLSVAYRKRARTDSPKARAAKAAHSCEAQRVLNKRLSHIGLTGIIAGNFADCPTARFVTLTFDKDHYPKTDREGELFDYAYNQTKLFLQRARRLTDRRGQELRTVFVIGGGNNIRYHIHVIADLLSGADLIALWGRGNVDHHLLSSRQEDPEKWDFVRDSGDVDPAQVAGYMMGNAACVPLGKHPWHASRNCSRPDRLEESEIPDNSPIPVPDGADVINEERRSNAYSEFRVLELILPKPQKIEYLPEIGERLIS